MAEREENEEVRLPITCQCCICVMMYAEHYYPLRGTPNFHEEALLLPSLSPPLSLATSHHTHSHQSGQTIQEDANKPRSMRILIVALLISCCCSPSTAWVSQMQLPQTSSTVTEPSAALHHIINANAGRSRIRNTRIAMPKMGRASRIRMSTTSDASIEQLTVPELKEQLRERGLKVCR